MTVQGDFTRAGYRALLAGFLARGYRGCRFDEAIPDRPDLLLRHDIDLWPEAAVELARIEAELGLTADYFFLMRSPLYNPSAPDVMGVFRELQSLGHRIGLHFDAALYSDDSETLNREATRECGMLETLTQAPVTLISFHRPAKSLLGQAACIGGRPHTYQPRFMTEIGYCSDSRGQWRYGHPLATDAVAKGHALQLLTHPVWWANDNAGDRESALAQVMDAAAGRVRDVIAQTVTGYSPETGRILDTD